MDDRILKNSYVGTQCLTSLTHENPIDHIPIENSGLGSGFRAAISKLGVLRGGLQFGKFTLAGLDRS